MTVALSRSSFVRTRRREGGLSPLSVERILSDLARGPIRKVRAILLLGGSVRSKSLARLIGRSLLDLPVGDQRYLGDLWRGQCAEMLAAGRSDGTVVRLLLDRQSAEPLKGDRQGFGLEILTERDSVEYRGTGGVLRDATGAYDDDDVVLVASAGQLLRTPLAQLVRQLDRARADLSLVSDTGGAPCGFMLVRCGCLRDIPSQGFVDMKEQALPLIARRHEVHVVEVDAPADPIRTCAEYVEALRNFHASASARRNQVQAPDGLDGEGVESLYGLVEDGARVHPEARIHDSVVLEGARVEKGAVVVRSMVCAGAVVRAGRRVVDELVLPAGGRSVVP